MTVFEQTAVELRRAAGEARTRWGPLAWLSLGALVVAAAVPFLSLPGVRVDALAGTAYLALAATALGLTVGPAGLPSLGTGAFMAIGAFTSALLVARSGWPLEPAALAGTAAALAAGLLSGGVVRLRRAFVAVSTWLLAWLVWLKADRIWAYRDATDVLRIVYGPFVYFMAVMIGLTGLIASFYSIIFAYSRQIFAPML